MPWPPNPGLWSIGGGHDKIARGGDDTMAISCDVFQSVLSLLIALVALVAVHTFQDFDSMRRRRHCSMQPKMGAWMQHCETRPSPRTCCEFCAAPKRSILVWWKRTSQMKSGPTSCFKRNTGTPGSSWAYMLDYTFVTLDWKPSASGSGFETERHTYNPHNPRNMKQVIGCASGRKPDNWHFPSVAKCHWVPLGATGCHWVPLGATGCHWVPLGATGCHWVPLAGQWIGAAPAAGPDQRSCSADILSMFLSWHVDNYQQSGNTFARLGPPCFREPVMDPCRMRWRVPKLRHLRIWIWLNCLSWERLRPDHDHQTVGCYKFIKFPLAAPEKKSVRGSDIDVPTRLPQPEVSAESIRLEVGSWIIHHEDNMEPRPMRTAKRRILGMYLDVLRDVFRCI